MPGSKLLVLGMVIQPLIGNPYNRYINPYYRVDDHPILEKHLPCCVSLLAHIHVGSSCLPVLLWKLGPLVLDSHQELFSRCFVQDSDLQFVSAWTLREQSLVNWESLADHYLVLSRWWVRL